MSIQGYAYDLVLFAPTAAGLKFLIERIENLILDHKLMINVAKKKVFVQKLMINVAKKKVLIFKPVGRVLGANILF